MQFERFSQIDHNFCGDKKKQFSYMHKLTARCSTESKNLLSQLTSFIEGTTRVENIHVEAFRWAKKV